MGEDYVLLLLDFTDGARELKVVCLRSLSLYLFNILELPVMLALPMLPVGDFKSFIALSFSCRCQ